MRGWALALPSWRDPAYQSFQFLVTDRVETRRVFAA
jgi:hypothetical protein